MLDMKTQRVKLQQYQKRLEGALEAQTKTASQLVRAGKKDRALLVLKHKKLQQKQLEQTDELLLKIEEMINSVEFAQMEASVFANLKTGLNSLKEIQSQMDIEQIDILREETQEAFTYQRQLEEALYGKLTDEDEGALESELDSLLEELGEVVPKQVEKVVVVVDTKTDAVEDETPVIELPEVPSNPLPVIEDPISSSSSSSSSSREPQKRVLVEAS
eukprot:TRINITY_DN1362_c4_g1_i1.p1 TRINITY_DN1362_c4_g1~~TRINITY_DN1362_c4_g1_i1.p1  ORF type:complete len:250 (-),score=112.13 TRINITY_DN1362_c4_g1_i1:19-669(-)